MPGTETPERANTLQYIAFSKLNESQKHRPIDALIRNGSVKAHCTGIAMQAALDALFEPSAFSPHGFCLLWEPGLLWVHAISDGLIGLAYYSIPVALLQFVRKRKDIDFGWIIGLFGAFILACGTTHFMSIVTLWEPLYWLEGIIKLLTAFLSVATAILLWPQLPRLLAMPSPSELRLVNDALSQQIQERDRSASILREREAQLLQSQKMEGLGQLAGGIAHDFNNVLQVVSGGIKLVLQRANDEKAVEQLSLMILASVERGAAITGRLLSFAHKGDLRAVRLIPKDFLEGLCEILAHTLSTEIIVKTHVEPGIPPILADKAQLETVILNLALNARDAMPDGGTLTLSIALETVDNSLHRDALMAGSYVRLMVIDTGQGMDQKTLSRAGEPFFTTKPVGEGTGLGLAMARGFVQQSGGKFNLQSKLGAGTTVTLWLPVANDQMDAAETSNVGMAHPDLERATVMVVDDNTMVREVLARHLEYHGCTVRRASDGLDALALMDSGMQIDVLVTDFAMPGMNGLILIEECRRRHPNLPAIMLTGFADASLSSKIEKNRDNATVLLRKPVSADDLLARVALLVKRPARF